MKCPTCHHDNPDNTKFCGECGASLQVDLGSLSPTRTILGPVLHLKKGQMIAGKYKIVEKIGEGGMGIVYKAEDTKLKRNVALKFLPSELTRDKKAKARFIQEAQAAAALNHSHICTVYEVDESDDQTFIAMEFIEGQTLKERIEGGPLSGDEAIDIASQVAEGLGEAHKKGIVHRDIKPANVMLAENGRAKIMDFGLAKLSWGADLTKPSMIMGTVAYMSPEQARGEPVDHRTDIWSLGAMLYEMLAGEKPFQKSHEQALIHSILNDEPRKISDVRSDVPNYLEKTITKVLEKNVDRRYQTAADVLRELKKSPAIVFPEPNKSIVVLPFENLSPDPDQEYFCDGMTEEIITDLSHIHDLLVISRSSAMTFKGTKGTIKEIADKVNVRYVLEGSVRKAGNNLRITAQLIDAKTDAHLWAEKYSGTLDDVFDLQEDVSRSIVDTLSLRLDKKESVGFSNKPIKNVRAYDCYLRARYDIESYTKDGFDRALQHLNNGLEIIGENALIYAGIGYTYWNYANQGFGQEECINKAEEFAERALKLDPNSAEAHLVLGAMNQAFWGNQERAFYHLKKSLVVKSDDPHTLVWACLGYYCIGKFDTFVPFVDRSVQIDPLNPMIRWLYAGMDLGKGRFDQAAQFAWEHLPPTPNFIWMQALALAYAKKFDKVRNLILKRVKLEWDDVFASLLRILNAAIEREFERMEKLMTDDFIKTCQRDPMWSYWVASIFALAEQKEKALTWLVNATDRGFINHPLLNEYDPFLENIRGEPRFKKLMERVKHEWDNFEV